METLHTDGMRAADNTVDSLKRVEHTIDGLAVGKLASNDGADGCDARVA